MDMGEKKKGISDSIKMQTYRAAAYSKDKRICEGSGGGSFRTTGRFLQGQDYNWRLGTVSISSSVFGGCESSKCWSRWIGFSPRVRSERPERPEARQGNNVASIFAGAAQPQVARSDSKCGVWWCG